MTSRRHPGARSRALTRALLALCAGALLPGCRPGEARTLRDSPQPPEVLDSRLRVTLFAAEPDIVTPIGVAVDRRDRVYVLESHTHLPPSGYSGPEGDRVKVLFDDDHDGVPERIEIFAGGLEDGMNLAFSPAGELYVATARAVWRLHDRDGDGVSEDRTRVLALTEPDQVYDHAGLLGITFSPDGWLYLSRGNTGGQAWRLEGTDGSWVGGYGDGGNIVRSRPDGSGLEEVATGFWNPFDLKFDGHGRLLAADNDPDSRGPNRLVHVVGGGDYGYKSLYGGSGIHAYLAWNGELPGTLPYAAPLGEAPSGLLDAGLAALPADYRDAMLVTIWEESRVVRVRVSPRGFSVRGEVEPVIRGGPDFRPVALAADSRGTIYLTDWVTREYPNHGRGRVWRIETRPGVRSSAPRAQPPADPAPVLAEQGPAPSPADFARLREALSSPDPFLRHAAVAALSAPRLADSVEAATRDPSAEVRLGALLALRRGSTEGAEDIARRLLEDPDARVRQMALIWAGEAGMLSLVPELERSVRAAPVPQELFRVYLATVEQLRPEFVEAYRSRSESHSASLPRHLPAGFLAGWAADESRPVETRALAVRSLADPEEHAALLARLAGSGSPLRLRAEAVRSLSLFGSAEGGAALLALARDTAAPAALRADALAGLARHPVDATGIARTALGDRSAEVREEAARYLRARSGETRDGESVESRPSSPEGWQRAVAAGGRPGRGRRVFFSAVATCSACHTAEGRGGDIGPDLTNIGRSKSREQILHSILRPSDEVSPEWQGWYVKTADGSLHQGRQIDVGDGGKTDLYVLPGRFASFRDVVEYGPAERSLMPEGLEERLTVEEMRDLLAYLQIHR